MRITKADFGVEQVPPQPACPELAAHLPSDHPHRLWFEARGAEYDERGNYIMGTLAGEVLPENYSLDSDKFRERNALTP